MNKCSKCGHDCTLGVDAVETPDGVQCDNCTGIERAHNGMIIPQICKCYTHIGDNINCPVHGRV